VGKLVNPAPRVEWPCRRPSWVLSYYGHEEAAKSPQIETKSQDRFQSMSIDKSLRRKNSLERARNVLTRGERIKTMQKEERWQDGRSPYGLPKVRVFRIVIKKAKKAKEEEKAAGEEGAAAAPVAGAAPAAGTEKKAGDKKAPEKK